MSTPQTKLQELRRFRRYKHAGLVVLGVGGLLQVIEYLFSISMASLGGSVSILGFALALWASHRAEKIALSEP